jgi:hypothetical protein
MISCDSREFVQSFLTSESVKDSDMFDVNVRLPYAMRCTGKAFKSAQMFSSVTNLTPSVTTFQCYTDMLQKASEVVCGNSMKSVGEDVETLLKYITEEGTDS